MCVCVCVCADQLNTGHMTSFEATIQLKCVPFNNGESLQQRVILESLAISL